MQHMSAFTRHTCGKWAARKFAAFFFLQHSSSILLILEIILFNKLSNGVGLSHIKIEAAVSEIQRLEQGLYWIVFKCWTRFTLHADTFYNIKLYGLFIKKKLKTIHTFEYVGQKFRAYRQVHCLHSLNSLTISISQPKLDILVLAYFCFSQIMASKWLLSIHSSPLLWLKNTNMFDCALHKWKQLIWIIELHS